MKIHIISTSYNSNIFAYNNINSVLNQTFLPASHTYIDDMSNDNSIEILEKIKKSKDFSLINEKYDFQFIINDNKKFKIKNMFDLINDSKKFKDEDIVCVLDGDDWLSSINVLKEVHNSYQDNLWDYLYTNWMYSHNKKVGISRKIPNKDWDPYEGAWLTSAMSTFKVKCFRSIHDKNFKDDRGNWFTMGCDQAYVLPILKMSQKKHGNYSKVGFINKPYYVYQFLENPNKSRDDSTGKKMANDAYNAVTLIRNRGLIE